MKISERLQRRLARRTTSGRFIAEIDGLRFPAIAIVVIGHLSSFFIVRGGYGPPTGTLDRLVAAPDPAAGIGVVLFFIISGFILALPFARFHRGDGERVSLRAYFVRRLTRLEPPYLISLVVLVVLEILAAQAQVAGRSGTAAEILPHFGASAVYLHNLIFGGPSTINPPAWSLEIEVQFYVLVPILTLLFAIERATARRAAILALVVASIGLRAATGDCCSLIMYTLLGSLHYFLLGFLLADIYLSDPSFRDGVRSRQWDVISLVGWPMVFVLWHRGAIGTVLLPFVAFAVFVAVFRGAVTNRIFTNGWITTIGGMCYSIYLVHFEMGAALGRAVRHVLHPTGRMWVDFIVEAPVILAINLCVCVAFYTAIERPCMNPAWPRRLIAFFRARTTTPSASEEPA